MNRNLHRLLALSPKLTLALLRATGRGSMEKRLFLQLVKRGHTVLDIGANRGHFTVLFSHLVGARGVVHAFEPVPTTFAMLKKNAATLTAHPNCKLQTLALGEHSGRATMFQPGTDDGQASLRTHEHGSWGTAQSVAEHSCEVATLDEYARHFPRLDFIKCDVEGGELPILRGARTVLERHSPVLYVEVVAEWARNFGYTPGDLVRFLREAGYDQIYLVTDRVQRLVEGMVIDQPANLLCAKGNRIPDGLEA